jgi:hypothetical protein
VGAIDEHRRELLDAVGVSMTGADVAVAIDTALCSPTMLQSSRRQMPIERNAQEGVIAEVAIPKRVAPRALEFPANWHGELAFC